MNKLLNLIRTMGMGDAALHVISRIVRVTSFGTCELRRHYFFSQPVRTAPLLPARRGSSIVVRPIASDDVILASFPRPAAEMAARFAHGSECFVAEQAGKLAGFLWIKRDEFFDWEIESRFVPAPAGAAVWDFDIYIDPKYRGGFVFARLWDGVNQTLAARGVRFSVSRVLADNDDSLRAHARLGAFPVGSAIGLTIGKRRWLVTDAGLKRQTRRANAPNASWTIVAEESARRHYRRFARLAGFAPAPPTP